MKRLALALLACLLWFPALAQEETPTAEEERSLFTTFLEDQLSTENRQIRISGIQGALSSEATIGEITIADREGVWLRVSDAVIEWSRSALILQQRLEVQRLGAESVEIIRRPLPAEGLPSPEARSFSIPELPIAINLAQLNVSQLSFGEDVFGLASTVSVEGRLHLEAGSLDTALEIERLDGPGGHLSLQAQYDNESDQLDLDLTITEPENGILANLLNIEGRPPLSLTLNGSGPVENLDLTLALDVADQPTLSGTARFRQQAEGLGFTVDLAGSISRLVPSQFRGFFGNESNLEASGIARTGGGLRLEELTLTSAALELEATAETASDGFLTELFLDADISGTSDGRVLLPVKGGETSVESAHLTVRFGEGAGTTWQASLDVVDLRTGTLAAETATITATGEANNLSQPDTRSITFDTQGTLSGIVAERADVAEALGDAVQFEASGSWQAGQALSIAEAELTGQALTASIQGTFSEFTFRGDIGLQTESLAPFSGLADRQLGGSLDLTADGEVSPISGAFDLSLDGAAESLRIGTPAADALLTGQTRITGRVARSEAGLSADNLRVVNEQVELTANGRFASDAADFRFDAVLADLALLTDRAQGRLTASGSATGTDGLLNLALQAEIPSGRLLDKQLSDAELGFNGTLQDGTLAGDVTGNAFLDGVRAQLASRIVLTDGERRLSNLEFSAEGARISGDLVQNRDRLLSGNLSLDAPDISTLAALFLEEAQGAIQAEISLEPQEGEQNATISATLRDVVTNRFSVDTAEVQADIADLFGVPEINGTIDANGLSAAGVDVASLSATAETSGDTTEFAAEATLQNGTDISAQGSLSPQDGGFTVALQQAELEHETISARLVSPTSLSVRGQTVTFQPVELQVGSGRIVAQGEIGASVDVALSLDDVPLSIANTVRPDLALGGTLSGEADISGPRVQPRISFALTGSTITADALAQAGIASLTIEATGSTENGSVSVDASVTSPGGLNATIDGTIPLGQGQLALDVSLQSFPLTLLNARIPGQDLGGTLTGTARITGTLAEPEARFQIRANDFTAQPISAFGAAPLAVTASGRYSNQTIRLESSTASGPGGLSISASGAVPLSGTGLNVDVDGTVPLTLANRFLANRGAQVTGTASVDLQIRGSADNPVIGGNFTVANAAAVDPMTNLRLTDIRVNAALRQDTIVIQSGAAAFAAGGTISLSGSISTNAAAGFPADLTINLNETRYVDRDFVTATLSGSLALQGPLTRDPLLSGNLTVANAEIIVPENFGGGPAEIDVKHVAPPPAVARTLERARADDGTAMPSGRPSVLRLNVNIDAPARIFVRGRGLDAELGGSITLTGPITSVRPVGAFQLIRGRLSILTQRLTFDEGTVTLVGDLDPVLNFVARSAGRDITVFITVSGRVSDLDISFSSQPPLPEDEVLARLIFNRGIDELSPIQLAQLAAAAAELAGGSDASLFSALREATGLEDIDIITDAEGNPAVRFGNYIQENVYVGVEAGTGGDTRATINLDITEDLKARGSLGTDGDSRLGIFYERDY